MARTAASSWPSDNGPTIVVELLGFAAKPANPIIVVDIEFAARKDDPHATERPCLPDEVSDDVEVPWHPSRSQADGIQLRVDDE